jgi:membrane protein DedA with SNARE-associated domain
MHDLMRVWFEWSRDAGYLGVFTMMALESTVVPIPSEIVMPPAAYWAAQGRMSLPGVILAGGLGSTVGSSLCYWFTWFVGRAFVARWGKWFLLPPERLALAERWLADFALGGVFFARLLPVVRHLIGFPAGLIRVPFGPFAAVTFVGSTLWCAVLGVFGARTLGRRADLLEDPSALASVIKHDLWWFVAIVALLGGGWLFVKWFQKRRVSHV